MIAAMIQWAANGAILDDARCYRYRLWRTLDTHSTRTMAVIGVNPSTANEADDDATIRRCRRFALDSGHGRLEMINVFGWRDRDVTGLAAAADPEGPDNWPTVMDVASKADTVVCAWGAVAKLPPRLRHRPAEMARALRGRGIVLSALAVTLAGDPAHPCYLPARNMPFPWEGP